MPERVGLCPCTSYGARRGPFCSYIFGEKEGGGPGQAPPRFYEVSCDINYRKLGSLFVDVTYTLHCEASPEPWRTFTETLLVEK